MGLGTEILVILVLGFLVLGPKQMQSLLGHVARAKAHFEEASRGLKSQLTAELGATHVNGETDASHEIGGGPVTHPRIPGIGTANQG